ncbi:hypothetical protein KIN20_025464 [Parelaphostrongylus tenuis]|uniref:Uncharacterized protein n=1 Tax=Parelaphostrongylus tenuis TaxID=148309 RepID=A0AAD5MV97_PARTN|nr:hypothetical protein KIN20_025464 [Parelaphostrongylus tenuis]
MDVTVSFIADNQHVQEVCDQRPARDDFIVNSTRTTAVYSLKKRGFHVSYSIAARMGARQTRTCVPNVTRPNSYVYTSNWTATKTLS